MAFTYQGLHRVAEPHDYGVLNGIEQLLVYQVGGEPIQEIAGLASDTCGRDAAAECFRSAIPRRPAGSLREAQKVGSLYARVAAAA
jgi:hypothetical protein